MASGVDGFSGVQGISKTGAALPKAFIKDWFWIRRSRTVFKSTLLIVSHSPVAPTYQNNYLY
jgi:hypothetical protein